MIETAEQMYKAFLAGIKKEQTSIVTPPIFDLIINEEQNNWLKEKFAAIELDQKRIDDLQCIRVATDGEYKYQTIVLNPIGPDAYEGRTFSLPYDPAQQINNMWAGVPPSATTQVYPKYRRLLNIEFKIKYINHECGWKGESEWLSARIMRTDQKTETFKNPYRKPKDNRLYYEIIGNKIRLVTGTMSVGIGMKLEYLRYPRSISFVNGINCEFLPEQQQEIVDRAVVSYIERSKNTRYQSIKIQENQNQQFK